MNYALCLGYDRVDWTGTQGGFHDCWVRSWALTENNDTFRGMMIKPLHDDNTSFWVTIQAAVHIFASEHQIVFKSCDVPGLQQQEVSSCQ